MPIQIPATSASAKPCVVPDHFKLADGLQLALNQLGDGFFAFKGSLTVGGISRLIKELNGEVIPGTGLQVKVRDFAALVDGVILTDKNKAQFDPLALEALAVSVGNSFVVLAPARVTGTDGLDRPDFQRGVLSVQATPPASDSGKILVAALRIPSGTTQVSSGMIDASMKPYLQDLGKEALARASADAALLAQIGAGTSDLSSVVNLAKTNFKIDNLMAAGANDMFKGWIDVFVNLGDVDAALSPDAVLDGLRRVIPNPGGMDGLLAYYKMDEPDGSTVLLDSSPSGLTGAVLSGSGAPPSGNRVAGIVGNGIDGAAGFFGVAPVGIDLDAQKHWTMSVWAKRANADMQWAGLLANRTFADWSRWVNLGMRGDGAGQLYLEVMAQDGSGYSLDDIAVARDTDMHLYAMVRDGADIKVYVDEALVHTKSIGSAAVLGGSDRDILIGAMNPDGSSCLNGVSDEASVFGRALSAEEIAGIFASKVLSVGTPATSADVVSKAHAAGSSPSEAVVVADGSADLALSVSRDDGATWVAAVSGAPVAFSTEPAGTAVRYKARLPAQTSNLDNIAVFWK